MNEASALAQIVILITVVGGFAMTWFNEARKRKWEIEDRRMIAERLAEKVETTALQVKADLDAQTADVKQELTIQTARVEQAADRAYNEANRLNEKLKTVTEAFDRTLQASLRDARVDTKLDSMHQTETDTNVRVRKIEGGTD